MRGLGPWSARFARPEAGAPRRKYRPTQIICPHSADGCRRWHARATSDVARAAALITAYDRTVLLVARGTSDYGALYGKYLAEIVHRVPCGLVSPSTMPAYGAQPDLSGVLMVGVSESGGSPDLVQSLKLLCKRHWLRRRQSRAPEDDPATDGHTCY